MYIYNNNKNKNNNNNNNNNSNNIDNINISSNPYKVITSWYTSLQSTCLPWATAPCIPIRDTPSR